MNIKIVDTYKLKDDEIYATLVWYLEHDFLDPSRTIQSYVVEVYAHNWLYNHHLFRKHTKDSDLEGDESKLRLIGYGIIYRLFYVLPRLFRFKS